MDAGAVVLTEELAAPGDERLEPAPWAGIVLDALDSGKTVGVLHRAEAVPALLARAAAGQRAGFRGDASWTIDLWPVAVGGDGLDVAADVTEEMILQLGTIVHSTRRWRDCTRLRLFAVAPTGDEEALAAEGERLRAVCAELRVGAAVHPLALPAGDPGDGLGALMRAWSDRTCLAIAMLPSPSRDPAAAPALVAGLAQQLEGLPPTLLVHATGRAASRANEAI